LESIRKILENDTELKQTLSRLETAQKENHLVQNQLKNAEAEVTAQKIKIEHADSSLYGGTVKNPKELQDLQKDIVSLKKHLTTLEERELELMLTAEKTETELQSAQDDLAVFQAKLGNEHKKLLEEQATCTTQLASRTSLLHSLVHHGLHD
jgi:predicted  nucleic acid-binding Zn-ribbon protein